MADRIAIMEAGRIVQLGPPEEVYNRPASPFVAAFMGADNVIALDVRRDGRGARGRRRRRTTTPRACRSARDRARTALHLEGAADGKAIAHFRSEAARLVAAGEAPPDSLSCAAGSARAPIPAASIATRSTVGERRFMVDDPRRLATGERGRHLPAGRTRCTSIRRAARRPSDRGRRAAASGRWRAATMTRRRFDESRADTATSVMIARAAGRGPLA